ncbi:glycosyl transferase, partial [Blyttiomyces helicus]
IAPEGPTNVWSLAIDGTITEETITPEESFGLKSHPLTAVSGGDPTDNAAPMRALLGDKLPHDHPVLNFVLLNSAALLFVSGKVATLPEGVEAARESIRSGKALDALERFAAATQAV